jgi:hypothetical protein
MGQVVRVNVVLASADGVSAHLLPVPRECANFGIDLWGFLAQNWSSLAWLRFASVAGSRALRTVILLLSILRTGRGTAMTFMSGGTRYKVYQGRAGSTLASTQGERFEEMIRKLE